MSCAWVSRNISCQGDQLLFAIARLIYYRGSIHVLLSAHNSDNKHHPLYWVTNREVADTRSGHAAVTCTMWRHATRGRAVVARELAYNVDVRSAMENKIRWAETLQSKSMLPYPQRNPNLSSYTYTWTDWIKSVILWPANTEYVYPVFFAYRWE